MAHRTLATAAPAARTARIATPSYAQQGFWLLSQLPGAGAAHVCRTYRVTGPLQLDALQQAWWQVLQRHEALRTTLVEVDGQPAQRIGPGRRDSLVRQDLDPVRASPEHQPVVPESRLDQLCAEWAAAPLPLAHGPLARLVVLRRTGHEHWLLLVAHQAVADDHSLSIVVDELSSGYRAAVAGAPEPTGSAPPPGRYADYADWQRGEAAAGQFPRLLSWWLAELAPAPAAASVADRTTPAGGPQVGWVTRGFDWGTDLAGRLGALAAAVGTTRQVVWLAALQVLLSRHTGQPRVVVGVPSPVRPVPALAGVVGQCENLLPLCGDLSGPVTFQRLLARLARTARRAGEHRAIPFQELVRGSRWDRDGRLPFCPAVLVVREPATELDLPGLTVQPRWTPHGWVPSDLLLTVDHRSGSAAGGWGYEGDRLEQATGVGLLGQLHTLLGAAVRQPDQPVQDLPLQTREQLRVAVRQADARRAAAVPDQPVHRLVSACAARVPAAAAVAYAGAELSYRDLVAAAAGIAGRFRAAGGIEGAGVAVRMAPGPWQVAASLAVLQAGGHLTWFSRDDTGARGRAVLAHLRPAYLLLDGDRDGAAGGDPLASWFRDELGGRVVYPAQPAAAGPVPEPLEPPEVGLERVAYVAYTAGSTGEPKGVAQSHAAFAQFVTWLAGELDLGPGSRVAQWAALEHDPSLCEVFATLVAGGTLCPVPPRIRAHPEKLLDWLARERVTVLQVIPSFARELLAAIQWREPARPLESLRRLVLMGEPLAGELANALRAELPWVRLANLYGPTETIAATIQQVRAPVTGRTTPIGRPLPGRQVLVLDERDRPCPAGVLGELVVRSQYAVTGYFREPAGGPAFRPVPGQPSGGWYRTGDLARHRADGLLEYAGRKDLQVKLAGTRVELAEVESVLADHPSVVDCAVAPVTDRDGLVQWLVAFVVPRRDPAGHPTAGVEQWRGHLRARFGRSMVRVRFTTVREIPRNVTGKVDRRRLPDPRRLAGPAGAAPHGRLEQGLAEIWAGLLGCAPATTEDNFFELGGDSLSLPRLVMLVRERFGVDLPLAACFAAPTLAGMAAAVGAAGAHRPGPAPAAAPAHQHRKRG